MDVIYRLLGELEIGPDAGSLELPSGITLTVLAVLLVNANRRMSKAELIRAVWGSDEAREAQLHKRVMAVRVALGQVGRRDDVKTHTGFGYELRAAEDEVDALLFRRLVREAGEAQARHRAEDEIGCLRRALGLWRGPHPLSNVPSEAFCQEIAALEQRRKRAAVRLFELELERGRAERILDELTALAGLYPADGRLREQLMVAQYRCGHLADVAEGYERYRQALEEETGAPPDPLLRRFHFAVARGDEAVIAAAESAITGRTGAPPAPAPAVPRQLPRAEDLVGRDHLAAEVSWLLRREPAAAAPVIVISGPGGIGKTALALRAAHECRELYPDGQLYLELRGSGGGTADISEVLAQFLRALGLARVPETRAERLAEYRTILASRRVLVLLDDAASGTQVSDLIPASPGCAVLVTARRRLPDVSGAHHVAPLEPLTFADATEMFLRIVRDAGISLTGDLDAVGQVVALCGGLPLALRIAGALRVHSHPRPTAELVRRLAAQGPEAFSFGELNVARTIGAGFERLDAAPRRLFLGLGLLPLTRFGLWTAEALLDGAGLDPAAALSQLAATFMIEPEPGIQYRFHDLTREYSRRRALSEYPGARDAVPGMAYRALLTLVRRAHAGLYGGDFEVVHGPVPDWAASPEVLAEVDAAPLAWFEQERASIRAAVGHCAELGLTSICWDLAVSAHEFYTIRGYHDDWYATGVTALAACRKAGDQRGEGIVLACLGQPALVASRPAGDVPGVPELERAVGLLAGPGDRHAQAIALRTLAHALRRLGRLTESLAVFGQALAGYEASGDTVGRWQVLRFTGQTHLVLRHYAEARHALEAAGAAADELADARLIAQTRYWTGQACLAAGDIDGAQVAFDAVFDACGDGTGVARAYAVHGLGDAALARGALGVADRYLTEAATLASEGEDAFLEGRAWLSIAALHQARRQPAEQAAALQRAAAVSGECGAVYLAAAALDALARALAGQHDTAGADAAWSRLERTYQAAGLPQADRIYQRPAGR
jgi:DNA-binding SARP family transcriptional activator/tetratricopeptide (TPR) repeat protein